MPSTRRCFLVGVTSAGAAGGGWTVFQAGGPGNIAQAGGSGGGVCVRRAVVVRAWTERVWAPDAAKARAADVKLMDVGENYLMKLGLGLVSDFVSGLENVGCSDLQKDPGGVHGEVGPRQIRSDACADRAWSRAAQDRRRMPKDDHCRARAPDPSVKVPQRCSGRWDHDGRAETPPTDRTWSRAWT